MRYAIVIAIVVASMARTIYADEARYSASQWKAGVASIVITPARPLRMAGYGARTDPADGTVQDLFAKCITVEDQQGQRSRPWDPDLEERIVKNVHEIVARLTKRD